MKILDVNVVVAAHREGHAHHEVAQQWLGVLTSSDEPFAVVDPVAASFVRVTTSRRIFEHPTPIDEAFAFLRALRAQPGHRMVGPGPRHLELLERTCREADATGDLVPDAQLVALAVEHAGEVVSFDRDFARFGVRWSRPEIIAP